MDSIRFTKVDVRDLRIGMYVVELDRPWLDTPFLVQGFVVKSVEELELISDLCAHVYVDTGRSRPFHKPSQPRTPAQRGLTKERLQDLLKVEITPYQDSQSLNEELAVVGDVYKDYDSVVTRFYDDIRINNRIAVAELQEPVNNIVDSIIRNPDACMLLTKLRRKGDYTYNHAIGCSVWAAAMGRQLGLPKKVMVSLSLGALLLDVGKLHVPDSILNKAGQLSPSEREIAHGHIDHGLNMLQKTKGVDNITFQMVLTHHERHNGKGYPRGLADKSIPVYGRIAGIVDTYDALVSDKPYRPGLAPSEAIRILYNVRDVDFQGELVEEFIQALGVYPAGSLVELSSGEVGIVVAENRRRRLRPRLLLLLDAAKQAQTSKTYLDLYRVTHDANGKPLEILRGLTPGEYGLLPEEIVV